MLFNRFHHLLMVNIIEQYNNVILNNPRHFLTPCSCDCYCIYGRPIWSVSIWVIIENWLNNGFKILSYYHLSNTVFDCRYPQQSRFSIFFGISTPLFAFTLLYASSTRCFEISNDFPSFIKSSHLWLFYSWSIDNRVPLLHRHYNDFLTTTNSSASKLFFATFILDIMALGFFTWHYSLEFSCSL